MITLLILSAEALPPAVEMTLLQSAKSSEEVLSRIGISEADASEGRNGRATIRRGV